MWIFLNALVYISLIVKRSLCVWPFHSHTISLANLSVTVNRMEWTSHHHHRLRTNRRPFFLSAAITIPLRLPYASPNHATWAVTHNFTAAQTTVSPVAPLRWIIVNPILFTTYGKKKSHLQLPNRAHTKASSINRCVHDLWNSYIPYFLFLRKVPEKRTRRKECFSTIIN